MNDYFAEAINSKEESLEHHGVLGQKWGVRRFQDKSGQLTAEGKARYNRDKVLNNIGRAITNTAVGQRLAVNLNKGYRADKKEIKALYEKKKAELGDDKEKQKSLKDDYKKTLGEARTTAAQVNYGWQSDAANKKIQTQSVGKAFLKSFLMGGTGAMLYDNIDADTSNKGAAAVTGLFGGVADAYTGGAVGIGNYVYGKVSSGKKEKSDAQNLSSKADNVYTSGKAEKMLKRAGVSDKDINRFKNSMDETRSNVEKDPDYYWKVQDNILENNKPKEGQKVKADQKRKQKK